MGDIKIIGLSDIESRALVGLGEEAGWVRRIIYPPHVNTKGIFFVIVEVNPGYSPHRWHKHNRDKAAGYEVVYPEGFEEFCYIIKGSGVSQWKDENGEIREEEVGPGDTICWLSGAPEHQLLNNGSENMLLAFFGCPTAEVTFTE